MNGLAFTATEAAAVTGLSVKAVNKAIENKLVPTKSSALWQIRKRYLSNVGLVCLQLSLKGNEISASPNAQACLSSGRQAPRQEIIRQSDALFIDLKTARQTLASRLFDLRKAKQMIIRDPEILNGMPVVRGTRVPVYLIVDMLNDGTTIQDILEGYPSRRRSLSDWHSCIPQHSPSAVVLKETRAGRELSAPADVFACRSIAA